MWAIVLLSIAQEATSSVRLALYPVCGTSQISLMFAPPVVKASDVELFLLKDFCAAGAFLSSVRSPHGRPCGRPFRFRRERRLSSGPLKHIASRPMRPIGLARDEL
jgi:hypothetical protein